MTSHHRRQFIDQRNLCSTYRDHSQDPIQDVQPFFFCPSSSPAASQANEETGELAAESSRSKEVVVETSDKKSDGQREGRKPHREGKDIRATFPWRLYLLVEDSMANGTDDIISWDDHGRSIRIQSRKALETSIMPR